MAADQEEDARVEHFAEHYARGAPWETGHAMLGATQRLALAHLDVGLIGQLLSAPTGLIWFAPFVVLVPVGLVLGWRERRDKLLLAG